MTSCRTTRPSACGRFSWTPRSAPLVTWNRSTSDPSSRSAPQSSACGNRWQRLLGPPRECGGALVTGATLANLSALAAARHALLDRRGWDVESLGLFGAPALHVYLGAEAHPSVRKALGLKGRHAMRISVSSWATRDDDVERSLESILRCTRALHG